MVSQRRRPVDLIAPSGALARPFAHPFVLRHHPGPPISVAVRECIRHILELAPAHKGQRLDRALAMQLVTTGLSRARIQQLIREGCCRLDRRTITDPAFRLPPSGRITLDEPPPVAARPEPQALPLAVIHEDEDLIVIDKPAGLVVHPAAGNPDGTLVNALLHHCGDSLSGIGGVARPGIVHRIDKDTSGLMVAAKNDAAHRALARLFANHEIERVYHAFVHGLPSPREDRIEGAIGRSPRDRKKMAVVDTGGKQAATRYRVERVFPTPRGRALAAHLTCRLETGRTHQVRVHMAHRGHPLIGDPLYGGRRRLPAGLDEPARRTVEAFGRQALHAAVFGFVHPTNGRPMRFESPLPRDLRELQAALETISASQRSS